MPKAFLDSMDIGNRALQHLGVTRISSPDEDSKNASAISFVYDKLREAELNRNAWEFAIKRAVIRPINTTTRILAPNHWSALTVYTPGAIVSDSDGVWWTSTLANNVGNDPATTNCWDQYFGPTTADQYDATQTYSPGEIVYKLVGNGGFVLFRSLTQNNKVAPDVATAWSATTLYGLDNVVSYLGSVWRSLLNLNLNIAPADAPLAFDASAIYAAGNIVTARDGYVYSSVGSGNTGNDPVGDGGVHWTNTGTPAAWTRTPTIYAGATSWLPLLCGLSNVPILYPIGTGPSNIAGLMNAFALPSGFLRKAPQDPKAGSVSYLGAPTNLGYDDWRFESGYLVSSQPGPLMVRFVADIVDVTKMNAMFCEGLACRAAAECCEELTQSTAKLTTLQGLYTKFMGEARTANAILTGSEEPPLDDYISCRV